MDDMQRQLVLGALVAGAGVVHAWHRFREARRDVLVRALEVKTGKKLADQVLELELEEQFSGIVDLLGPSGKGRLEEQQQERLREGEGEHEPTGPLTLGGGSAPVWDGIIEDGQQVKGVEVTHWFDEDEGEWKVTVTCLLDVEIVEIDGMESVHWFGVDDIPSDVLISEIKRRRPQEG